MRARVHAHFACLHAGKGNNLSREASSFFDILYCWHLEFPIISKIYFFVTIFNKFDWFLKWFRLYFWRIPITLVTKVTCIFNTKITRAFIRRGVNKVMTFFVIERGIQHLNDHVCRKYTFFYGWISDVIYFLKVRRDGTFWKWLIALFQELIASGKKQFIYLRSAEVCGVETVCFWNKEFGHTKSCEYLLCVCTNDDQIRILNSQLFPLGNLGSHQIDLVLMVYDELYPSNQDGSGQMLYTFDLDIIPSVVKDERFLIIPRFLLAFIIFSLRCFSKGNLE